MFAEDLMKIIEEKFMSELYFNQRRKFLQMLKQFVLFKSADIVTLEHNDENSKK